VASLSFYLVVVGGVALATAFALLITHLVLLASNDRALRAPTTAAVGAAAIAGVNISGPLGEAIAGGGVVNAERRSSVGDAGAALTYVGTAALGLSLIARALVVGRGPWGNLYEFSIAFAFGICAATLYFDRGGRLRALGTIAIGVALGLLAYAATLPNEVVQLVPALQHPLLLTIHVGLAMLSYGIFAFAFAAGVAYLIQGDQDRFSWLPPAKRLDQVAFQAVTVGFPLFAGMLILGSIWASIAWSRYWGWDPKEPARLAGATSCFAPRHRLRRGPPHLLREPLVQRPPHLFRPPHPLGRPHPLGASQALAGAKTRRFVTFTLRGL
jgi:ABC-type transport system involved in cytochrome c biogenesis permease subunit